MNQLLQKFGGMPKPVQMGLLLAIGGGTVGAVALFDRRALIAIAIGMVIVGVLLALYNGLLRQMQKRKSAPMERAIASNTSAAPVGISAPAQRARLDDLRKNFESGVEKFRAAGKDLYSLPWYALVGEPGSGKTEAIRHCNVGFPPGLQDQLQGAGGTLNMNWWFTNHAIIIDTAGRLMFEEVEPGSSSEWQEFLKLLRKSRPNCPINGMLLVIPAESLIRDTADALERKGGKIAAQLDQIQRALGVRFPVFVVITKCDLINGFREFFDDLTDPTLQHQILGWSNPANLDQPFNPELVDEHLRTVQQRLLRRRMGLLLDPVNTEDPKARRTDQVDALYAFPESLMKIAPRLRRYLEMIFVAGEWSAKPLFLRGIYFTSSMREGSALDADLADALGVPVENLPEGRVWERERAYFLRDLFMNKVFREKGLVTRAVNTTAQQRARRRVVYGTAAAGLLVIAGLTWQGATALRNTIVGPSTFWTGAIKAYKVDIDDASASEGTSEHYLPIVRKLIPSDEDFKYLGQPGVNADPLRDLPVSDKADQTRALFPLELKEQASRAIKTPWVFVPVAMVTGDRPRDLLGDERRQAARMLFEASVLRPLVDAAKVRIRRDSGREDRSWSPEATGALVQLVRLEVAGVPGAKSTMVEIDPLLKYALLGNDGYVAEGASKDAPQMQGVMEWLYSQDADKGRGEWPPISLRESNVDTITRGIDAFNRSWTAQAEGRAGGSGDFAKLVALAGAIREFGEAEKQLQAVDDDPGRDPALAAKEWEEKLAALSRAAGTIEGGLATLKGRPLARAFDEELTAFRGKMSESYGALLKELDSVSPAAGTPAASRAEALIDKRKALKETQDQLMRNNEGIAKAREDALRLDALYIVNPSEPAYAARLRAYKAADERLKADRGAPEAEPGALRGALKSLDDGLRADAQRMQDDLKTRAGSDPVTGEFNECVNGARGVSSFMLALAGQRTRSAVIGGFLEHAAETPEALADAVAAYANAQGMVPDRPKIPMTARRDKFDAKFAPRAAAAVVGDYEAVRNSLRAATAAPAGSAGAAEGVQGVAQLSPKFARAAGALDGYVRRYAEYWSDKVSDDLAVEQPRSWAEFVAELGRNNRASVYKDELLKAQKAVEEAAQSMSAVFGHDSSDQALTAAIDRLSRLAAQARATLDNSSLESRCDRFMTSWFGLGPDSRGAREQLLSKIESASGVREYFDLLPQGDLKDADLAQRFWRGLMLMAVRTLAAESTSQAADAVEDLLKRKARFPLGPVGKGDELTPTEIAQARESYQRVKAAIGPGSPGSDNWTSDAEINEELRKLAGRGLVKATDEDAIKRMGAMLDVLPTTDGEKVSCTVVALNTHPLDQGQSAISEPAPFARIGVGGRIVGLRGPDAELGSMTMPGEQTTIQFVRRPENDASQLVIAELPISSRWGPIMLIEKFKGTPAAGGSGRRWWDVPVEVMSEGRRYNVWIRLQFDRDLPEPALWPR